MDDGFTYVFPGGPGYLEAIEGPVYLPTGWQQFEDKSQHLTRYRKTSRVGEVWATYRPEVARSHCYLYQVFIPGAHATTRLAKYTITHFHEGAHQQTGVVVNQNTKRNQWINLGIFHIDPKVPESGQIKLEDKTEDQYLREIAFSAIRLRPVFGLDAPVGTREERDGAQVWPGDWTDVNPYLSRYFLGYHTGADLNLNKPQWDSDRNAPVYATGDGQITFAGETESVGWRKMIVIYHGLTAGGGPLYSRYGHVDEIGVKVGTNVRRGEEIARVGKSGGSSGNFHLHLDISGTHLLKDDPENWPGYDKKMVVENYVDPLVTIRENRPCRHLGSNR